MDRQCSLRHPFTIKSKGRSEVRGLRTLGAVAASFAIFVTAAWAGEAVYGYGETRSEAVADANHNAAGESRNRFGRSDCYTPVRPRDCSKDDDGWVCVAHVANHEGSCGF